MTSPSDRWSRIVLRLPKAVAIAAVTGVSVGLSVAATWALVAPKIGQPLTWGPTLGIAVLVPVLVATPVAALIVHLLHQVADAQTEAQRLASRDPLTGVLNRRSFMQTAAQQLAAAERSGTPLSLLMLDLDDFKLVNDGHGHAAGDAVLQRVARRSEVLLRRSDVIARWGGEEFVVLLPSTDAPGSLDVANRLLQRIAERQPDAVPDRVTTSIGVATARRGETLDALVARADAAMYGAKRQGKNRVCAATAPDAATVA